MKRPRLAARRRRNAEDGELDPEEIAGFAGRVVARRVMNRGRLQTNADIFYYWTMAKARARQPQPLIRTRELAPSGLPQTLAAAPLASLFQIHRRRKSTP
jgi:hypothetical protein